MTVPPRHKPGIDRLICTGGSGNTIPNCSRARRDHTAVPGTPYLLVHELDAAGAGSGFRGFRAGSGDTILNYSQGPRGVFRGKQGYPGSGDTSPGSGDTILNYSRGPRRFRGQHTQLFARSTRCVPGKTRVPRGLSMVSPELHHGHYATRAKTPIGALEVFIGKSKSWLYHDFVLPTIGNEIPYRA